MLADNFDCVVMLTWSDWKTESRSNRYHYATRFAAHVPVLFVQPDQSSADAVLETTAVEQLTIMHVSREYTPEQTRSLARMIHRFGFTRPLLWIYNPFFLPFVRVARAPLKVYHATEDFFAEGAGWSPINGTRSNLRELLKCVDLLVSVSALVQSSYRNKGGYSGRALVLENGCDSAFWEKLEAYHFRPDPGDPAKVALYQGALNWRVDAGLLRSLVDLRQDWTFWFCGRVDPAYNGWRELSSRPNVRYFGHVSSEEIAALGRRASVGLIPYVDDPLIHVSFPLKAFEYVACGLPVISRPIPALARYPTLFSFASTAEQFATLLDEVYATRSDPSVIEARRAAARSQGYDARFTSLIPWLKRLPSCLASFGPARVAILYDPTRSSDTTARTIIDAWATCSRNSVDIIPGFRRAFAVDLSRYDAAIIHPEFLSGEYAPRHPEFLAAVPGTRIMIVPDQGTAAHIAEWASAGLIDMAWGPGGLTPARSSAPASTATTSQETICCWSILVASMRARSEPRQGEAGKVGILSTPADSSADDPGTVFEHSVRFRKLRQALGQQGFNFDVLGWERLGELANRDHDYFSLIVLGTERGGPTTLTDSEIISLLATQLVIIGPAEIFRWYSPNDSFLLDQDLSNVEDVLANLRKPEVVLNHVDMVCQILAESLHLRRLAADEFDSLLEKHVKIRHRIDPGTERSKPRNVLPIRSLMNRGHEFWRIIVDLGYQWRSVRGEDGRAIAALRPQARYEAVIEHRDYISEIAFSVLQAPNWPPSPCAVVVEGFLVGIRRFRSELSIDDFGERINVKLGGRLLDRVSITLFWNDDEVEFGIAELGIGKASFDWMPPYWLRAVLFPVRLVSTSIYSRLMQAARHMLG